MHNKITVMKKKIPLDTANKTFVVSDVLLNSIYLSFACSSLRFGDGEHFMYIFPGSTFSRES